MCLAVSFFFCDTFFTAIGHMVRSPVLEGGGWGGGVVSSRFGEEIEKRGRVAVGVVGGVAVGVVGGAQG